jgi:hypothetical protein
MSSALLEIIHFILTDDPDALENACTPPFGTHGPGFWKDPVIWRALFASGNDDLLVAIINGTNGNISLPKDVDGQPFVICLREFTSRVDLLETLL